MEVLSMLSSPNNSIGFAVQIPVLIYRRQNDNNAKVYPVYIQLWASKTVIFEFFTILKSTVWVSLKDM